MIEINLFEHAMKLRQSADMIGWTLNELRRSHAADRYIDPCATAVQVLRSVAEDLICPRQVVERDAVRAPETGQGPAHQQTVVRTPQAIWGKPWPERPGRWWVALDHRWPSKEIREDGEAGMPYMRAAVRDYMDRQILDATAPSAKLDDLGNIL